MVGVASAIVVFFSLLILHPRSGSALVIDNACRITPNGASSATLGPWTALLHENRRIVCAGSLIHQRFILTAAHCLAVQYNKLEVRLGEYGQVDTKRPENYEVDKIFRHRYFNNITLENDIGLAQLARPVQYKDHIRPICILVQPTQDQLRLADSNTFFSGSSWKQGQETYMTRDFHTISIARASPDECTQKFPFIKDNRRFCGVNREESSCDGPSGSALSYVSHKWTLQLGIASFNFRDCEKMRVYTDVVRFSQWIQQVVLYGSSQDRQNKGAITFPNTTRWW